MTLQIVLFGLGGVLLVLYLRRRRTRLDRDL